MGKKWIAEGEWVFEQAGAKQTIKVDLQQQVVQLHWTVSAERRAQFEPNAGVIVWSIEDYLVPAGDNRLGFLDKPVRKEVIAFLRKKIGSRAWSILRKNNRK